MTYMGIDVGKKGGIALIENDRAISFPYSDEKLREVCKANNISLCIVEKVAAMPKQGVSSTFSFGTSFGYILGVLESHRIPYQLVSPRKWKGHFSLDNDKTKSIETAKRLFPQVSLLPTAACRKESDGMAEALLMALYGKRTEGGATK